MITYISLSDLRVPAYYLATRITKETLDKKRAIVAESNSVHPIIVDTANRLLDGYALLLAYLEQGRTEIPCSVDPYAETPMHCVEIAEQPVVQKVLSGDCSADQIWFPNISYSRYVWVYKPVHTLLRRQENKCYICGMEMCKGKSTPTVNLIVPKPLGGTRDLDNMAACCVRCGHLKGNKMLTDELRQRIIETRKRDIEKARLKREKRNNA